MTTTSPASISDHESRAIHLFLLCTGACLAMVSPACRPQKPERGSTHETSQSPDAREATGSGVAHPGAVPVILKWRARRLAVAGVTLDFVDGSEVTEVIWEKDGGTLYQTHVVDGTGILRLNLRAEKDEGMGGFRLDHSSWQMSSSVKTQVCGQPAELVRATTPSQHIVCVMTKEGNHPAYIPARSAVAVVFEHRGRPARVTFEIESDTQDVFEPARDHFLASIRCD